MNAIIINIGDELLIGQTVNTNATWMAQTLDFEGINVLEVKTIGDNEAAINNALNQALGAVKLVLVTGGLGPTKDDITKHVLANYFNTQLVLNEMVLAKLEDWYARRGRIMNDLNRTQALLPENCLLLNNPLGSACGMWFEKDDKVVVSLPGVPYELKSIFPEMLERIKTQFQLEKIRHLTFLTAGIVESTLAEKIAVWENNLPSNFKLAYLPKPGIVRLRLSASNLPPATLQEDILQEIAKPLIAQIENYHFGYNDDNLHQTIGGLLQAINATVSVAESCTGGLLSHFFTLNDGASSYFKGGAIVYDNELKINSLKVSAKLIKSHGAVSEEVVKAMALGAIEQFNTNFSVSISGIAGPKGGTIEKPIGTVWIAVAGPKGIIAKQYNLGDNRALIIERAAMQASFLLWRYLKNVVHHLPLNGLE